MKCHTSAFHPPATTRGPFGDLCDPCRTAAKALRDRICGVKDPLACHDPGDEDRRPFIADRLDAMCIADSICVRTPSWCLTGKADRLAKMIIDENLNRSAP